MCRNAATLPDAHAVPGRPFALRAAHAPAYEKDLDCLAPGTPVHATMQDCLQQLRERGLPEPAALRVLRQLVMERLVVLDCEQGAPLSDVTRGDRTGRTGAGRRLQAGL
jgi:hypothetical protein